MRYISDWLPDDFNLNQVDKSFLGDTLKSCKLMLKVLPIVNEVRRYIEDFHNTRGYLPHYIIVSSYVFDQLFIYEHHRLTPLGFQFNCLKSFDGIPIILLVTSPGSVALENFICCGVNPE